MKRPTFQSQAGQSSRYVIQALDLSKALDRILNQAPVARDSETVALSDSLGRVLSRTVTAPLDLPPFHSSAMDGYAFRSATHAGDELQLIGASLAGHPFTGTIPPGQCIRITTGAAVPDSADTVVIQENCEVTGKRIRLLTVPEAGQNIRPAGHDVTTGAILGGRGKRLNPFDIGWLAACGITQVEVCRKPRVAVFSTGDELMTPGGKLRGGQIFDANRYALIALLSQLPVVITDLGIIRDDRAAISEALSNAASNHDLLLTSGGVSVGDADYVKEVVEALGTLDLWRLNLKPGKPLAYGAIGRSLFVGLPGNPVSTIVTYLLITKPLLLKLAGADDLKPRIECARLAEPILHTPGREEYQRGISRYQHDITLVSVSGDQSSNRLATFSEADCLIRIPKDAGDLNAGMEVEILPFFGLI